VTAEPLGQWRLVAELSHEENKLKPTPLATERTKKKTRWKNQIRQNETGTAAEASPAAAERRDIQSSFYGEMSETGIFKEKKIRS
jgi:hypothetical protein